MVFSCLMIVHLECFVDCWCLCFGCVVLWLFDLLWRFLSGLVGLIVLQFCFSFSLFLYVLIFVFFMLVWCLFWLFWLLLFNFVCFNVVYLFCGYDLFAFVRFECLLLGFWMVCGCLLDCFGCVRCWWLVWVLVSFVVLYWECFGVYDLFCLYCAISLLFVMLCLF